jgi:hypothetical protein
MVKKLLFYVLLLSLLIELEHAVKNIDHNHLLLNFDFNQTVINFNYPSFLHISITDLIFSVPYYW